jgi:hypothetical protein
MLEEDCAVSLFYTLGYKFLTETQFIAQLKESHSAL